jgi:hypothetical protein
MTKKRRRVYAPRVFDGRIIMSDEIGRIKGFLEFERIEAVSDSMRELIEDLWPELVHKLSLKEVAGMTKCRPRPRTRPRS